MNAAAVVAPNRHKKVIDQILKWVLILTLGVGGMLLITFFVGEMIDSFTGEKNTEGTGVISLYFKGPEHVAERIRAKRFTDDQWRFYGSYSRMYMSPTCVDPTKWPTMSQADREHWEAFFPWLNRQNEAEARKSEKGEFTYYYRLVGTEHCYITEKRKLE